MEDFFKLEPGEPHVMTSQDFFDKTQRLLNHVANSYSQSWKSRSLKNGEFPDESVCDKCQGCGTFKNEIGEENECVQDKEQGQCYHRYFDYENLSDELETHLDDIYVLISVDELK